MNVARRFNDALVLTAGLSVVAFLIADQRMLLVLPALGVTILGWVCGAGKRAEQPWCLPRLAITLMVIGAIAYAASAAASDARTEPVVSVLGLFLSHITAIKFFDRRSPRDDAQLLALSLFNVIASVLTGNELLVGLIIAIITPSAITAAVLWQFRDGQATTPTLSPVWGRRGRGQLIALVCSATLAACAAATAIFVLAPRGWAQDVLGRFGQVRETTIGFNETPRLGQAGFLSQDQTPVLDVSITDLEGTNLGGPENTLYLRGAVKDTYDRDTWTWNDHAGERLAIADGRWRAEPAAEPSTRTAIQRQLRVSMRGAPRRDGPLFTLWRPVELRTQQRQSLRVYQSTLVLKRASDTPFPINRRPTAGFDYTVTMIASDEGGPLPIPPPNVFGGSRIEQLTRQVLQTAGIELDGSDASLRQAALVIREHLRTKFSYTTEMIAPAPGQDPIEMFLFETKRGHCEYFASAMVAMCQSVDIPARMVLGYVATEYNAITGQYLVRESNAHAWVESHIGRGRWMTSDPSPPAEIERLHRPGDSALAMVRRWWDALEFSWAKVVVSFDRSSQERILGVESQSPRARARSRDAADRAGSFVQTMRAEGTRGILRALAPILFFVALAVVAVRLFPSLLRRLRALMTFAPLDPDARRAAAEAPFYFSAMRALRRSGLAPPPSRPALAHAHHLESSDAQLAIALRELVTLFYRVRYGAQTLTPDERTEGAKLASIVASRAQAVRKASRRPTKNAQ